MKASLNIFWAIFVLALFGGVISATEQIDKKTLMFLIDEGLALNEITTVFGDDFARMDQALDNIFEGLSPLFDKYKVAFLIYPTWHYSAAGFDGRDPKDAAARISPSLHHVFSYCAAKGIPVYLEIMSSGIRTSQNGELGSQPAPQIHYGQGEGIPGMSMDMECLAMLKKKYGPTFAGVRFHELLGTNEIGRLDQERGRLESSHGCLISLPALEAIFKTVRDNDLHLVWGDHSWNFCYNPDGTVASGPYAFWDEQLNKAIDLIGPERITLNWANNGWPMHQSIVNDFFKKHYRDTSYGLSVQSWFWGEVDSSTTVVRNGNSPRAWIKWYWHANNDMPVELVAGFTKRAFEGGATLVQYEHPQYFFNYYPIQNNGIVKYEGYYEELPDYSVKLRTKRLIDYLLHLDSDDFPSTDMRDYFDADVHQFNGYKENSGARRYFQNTLGIVGIGKSRYFDKYNNDLTRWVENSENRFLNHRFSDTLVNVVRANINFSASDEVLLLKSNPEGITAEFYHNANGLVLRNSDVFRDNTNGRVAYVVPMNLFSEYIPSTEGDPDDYLVFRDKGTTLTPELYKVQTKGEAAFQGFDLVKVEEPLLLHQVVPQTIPREGLVQIVPLRTRNALTEDCRRPEERNIAAIHFKEGVMTMTAFVDSKILTWSTAVSGNIIHAASIDVDGDFKDDIAVLLEEEGIQKVVFYQVTDKIEPLSEELFIGKFDGKFIYSGRMCTHFKAY